MRIGLNELKKIIRSEVRKNIKEGVSNVVKIDFGGAYECETFCDQASMQGLGDFEPIETEPEVCFVLVNTNDPNLKALISLANEHNAEAQNAYASRGEVDRRRG